MDHESNVCIPGLKLWLIELITEGKQHQSAFAYVPQIGERLPWGSLGPHNPACLKHPQACRGAIMMSKHMVEKRERKRGRMVHVLW